MRERILDILGALKTERGEEDGTKAIVFEEITSLLDELTCAKPALNELEMLKALQDGRDLMLDIMLRLSRPELVDENRMLLAAEQFWVGTMREHFVHEAMSYIEKPAVRELFERTSAESESLKRFLVGLDHDIEDDLGIFIYIMLSGQNI
jgi:hypothetical protein